MSRGRRGRTRSGASGPGGGYSLVEVLVALVILQVGLLGAAGLVVTAARAVAKATRTDRALVLAGAVADSLLERGFSGGGERRLDEGWTVLWSGGGGWASVEVRDREDVLVVAIPVPVEAP